MFTIEFDIRDDVLHARVTGVVRSFEQAAEKANALVDKALETGVYRLLLDERNLYIDVDALDISQAVATLEDRGIPSFGGRTACLYRAEYTDIYKTYETVYRNRSFSYRLYDDPAKALDWLKE